MSFRLLAVLAMALAALNASAQTDAAKIAISVTVVEAGVGQPLADTEITVTEYVRQPYRATEVAKGRTDAQGGFHFEVGKLATYIVAANKTGYSDDGGSLDGASETVVLDKEHPSHEVRFALVRTGELTGRVVDDETGLPVSNFRVNVSGLSYLRGEAIWSFVQVPPTDADGRFTATGMRPGNYLVQAIPQVLYKERLQTEFTEADLKAVDHDYLNAYWPGGHDLASASPVRVPSGGLVGVGTVRVKKGNFYRIRVSMPEGACEPGEKIDVMTEMVGFQGSAGGEAPCNRDFLLRNYQPGSYLLYVLSASGAAHRIRVVTPFEVTDQNMEIKIPLARGPDITGQILYADGVAADGFGAPPAGTIQILMQTEDGPIQFTDERQPVTPDATGAFRFPEAALARERISVSGLGANYYVKEIRYNGVPLTDNIFHVDAGSPEQSIEIVIDTKPATITGTVTDSDKPVKKPYVVLVKWPESAENIFLAMKNATGDDSGQFRFTGLAPGEYRVLAVSQTTMGKLDEPGVLFRLLSGADTVTLERGGSQSLPLKVTDPGR